MNRFYRFLCWLDWYICKRQLEEYCFGEIIWLLSIGIPILLPISALAGFAEWLDKNISVRKAEVEND